jgi:hypothetical protein
MRYPAHFKRVVIAGLDPAIHVDARVFARA